MNDLERLVRATRGQGPSDEFRARLRARIVAETYDRAADPVPGNTTGPRGTLVLPAADEGGDVGVVLDLAAQPGDEESELAVRRPWADHRLWVVAAAAVVVIAAFGVWAVLIDDADTDLDVVNTTTTSELPHEEGIGELITGGNTFFDTGTYRVDTLGTWFTLTVEETRGMLLNENDVVLVTDVMSGNVDDRTIALRRWALLPDPTDPTDPTFGFGSRSGWPADDLAGWIERLSDDVTATVPVRTTLGGRVASSVELAFPCDVGSCSPGMPPDTSRVPMFTPGSEYRLWVVDQGPEDPIVVTVAIDNEDETAWFDEAEDILATLRFGEVEPNPARRVPPGPIDLDVFGGISLDLSSETIVVEPFVGFARLFAPDVGGAGGDVEFLTRPRDVDGAEVATIEQLVELLADEAAVLTDVGTIDVDGFEARTFDIDSGGIPNVVLKLRDDDLERAEFGWESPRFGSVWIIEHPDRGLLLVSSESFVGPNEIERLRPLVEQFLRALEFR